MSAKNLRLIAKGEASRRLERREKADPTAGRWLYWWVDVGIEYGRVEILADVDGMIEKLGRRALHSKRGRSVLLDGLIECRVIERRQVYNEGEPKK